MPMSCILKDFLATRQRNDDDFWVSFAEAPATFAKYSNLESFDCTYFKATNADPTVGSTVLGDLDIVELTDIAIFTVDDPYA